eukprot:CAMPEP_0198138300 /NCGR_PEP_ID=MMETSP1443-20131203/1707_1 /TAXON_ID=186043 /ORGANISM="Entomoneis sp., Strain CCMP2396" /LENGTH=135 /DNA_ID=CAMNT_0043800011 /DNA_START=211 /DNA_END=618 /DNA_ORIENTATION=-
MFSSVARAFTRSVTSQSQSLPAKSLVVARRQLHPWGTTATTITTPRFLSTETPETTIVDICKGKIQEALEAESVKVTGAYDDPNGSHISIEVVSSKFEGKRAVQRQQLVYKAIWEEMQGAVHAVDSMVCKAPGEA